MLEPNIYGLWGGKQTAKGTPNTAPAKRFNWVGGDFAMPRDDGSEPYSDLTKYGARSDWVNSLVGNGEPAVEATPTELAWLLWMLHGGETVSAVTGPPASSKHSFVPSTTRGHWGTFFKRIGLSQIVRHQFNDCLVGRAVIEGSTGNKALRATAGIISLDPGEVGASSDPAAPMPVDKVLLYTDGTGTFTIDGNVIKGQSQFTLTINEDLSPVYGDDVIPHDLVQGTAGVTLGVTLYFDADGMARFNALVYGTATPTAGTKPLKTIPALGSYAFNLQQRNSAGAVNGRRFNAALPSVKWNVPDAPGPNTGGGAPEIALTGELRPSGSPLYTLDVYTDPAVVAFTA